MLDAAIRGNRSLTGCRPEHSRSQLGPEAGSSRTDYRNGKRWEEEDVRGGKALRVIMWRLGRETSGAIAKSPLLAAALVISAALGWRGEDGHWMAERRRLS